MGGRMIGFIVWSIVGCILIGIGVCAYFSKKTVAFWANMKAFPVRDIKGYNHALGKLFIFYGMLFVVLGIPLLSAQNTPYILLSVFGVMIETIVFMVNQRIIAGNVQFKGIAAGRGVGFTTGLLLLRKGLGMQETPIRPHSWHCRMQSDYQYDGNRKRPPVWRRHRGSLRPRGRNLGRVEGMTGSCGSGCDPAIHARRLRVYHRPRRLRMASRISIFFAARRFEPLNSMG